MSKAAVRIRDIVDVRPHPTVVRLDDMHSADNDWLTNSFVLTEEVAHALTALGTLLERGHGAGVFLIGHYGSGKSHFLAWWARTLGSTPTAPTPNAISLLNYQAQMRLEDIVAEAVSLPAIRGDRRLAWDALLDAEPSGIVLLLDELSEFLRSKSDERAFNEDVRFLQFLGEWAQDRRFWIVAAMQESIEHAGDLEQGLYRKIKDRYPLRLALNPAHIEQLIERGILIKNDRYEPEVAAIVQRLRQAFPRASVDFSRLLAIYPIHPATLTLLEEIRDRFSQARGVIDFAVRQLRGQEERELLPFLDQPLGSLLTPDAIVDHFRDLFDIQPEFLPLAQKLLPWYDQHLTELFPPPKLQQLAERVLKLLILVHLAPGRQTLNLGEAADWLLFDASRLDPERNLAVLAKVLTRLATDGRYVVQDGDGYRLDLKHDYGGDFDRLLTRQLAQMPNDPATLLEPLAERLKEDAFSPFALPRGRWQVRHCRWHFHEWPYAVSLGDPGPAAAPPNDRPVRIDLPWGQGEFVATRSHSFLPAPVELSDALRELAAVVRMSTQALNAQVAEMVVAREQRLMPHLIHALRQAYMDGELIAPNGQRIRGAVFDTRKGFGAWLDQLALAILRQRYPAFERFAPSHGPLPVEARVALMEVAVSGSLLETAGDGFLPLIREAYLVPMGLLRRKGNDYAIPARLERHELVAQVLGMLDAEPAPDAVYRHFASSTYGLTEDQVALLLIFLLIQGEIDILKDRHSYRDYFKTLPNPLSYDRLTVGDSLDEQCLAALKQCVDRLGIKSPKQWSVLGQRRMIDALKTHGRQLVARLAALTRPLAEIGGSAALGERVQSHVNQWRLLLGDQREPLAAFEEFFHQLESLHGFLDEANALAILPERLGQMAQELKRIEHLRSQCERLDGSARELARPVLGLGSPPSLDKLSAVDEWTCRFDDAWTRYRESYTLAHDAWWKEANAHSIWRWQPPALAQCRHANLADAIETVDRLRGEAVRLRCDGLAGLDFQAQCRCGFDGLAAPVADVVDRFAAAAKALDRQLRSFFNQPEVRQRLKDWQAQGGEFDTQTRAYVSGDVELPGIRDTARLDAFLSGLDLCQSVSIDSITNVLTERVWQADALKAALARRVDALAEGRSLKFVSHASGPSEKADRDWLIWSLETALRHAEPLPPGMSSLFDQTMARAIDPRIASSEALADIDRLNLGADLESRMANALLNGDCELPPQPSSLAAAVQAVETSPAPADPDRRRAAATALYRYHTRLRPHAAPRVDEALERMATDPLQELPDLTSALGEHTDAQWLVIDCLGVTLLDALGPSIEKNVAAWHITAQSYARSTRKTDTEGFFTSLLDHSLAHRIHKIDSIDALVHAARGSFIDLERRAVAELDLALAGAVNRLDSTIPLIVTADHGFRLASTQDSGRGRYVHGGSSELERLVPFWTLTPRYG